MENEIKLAADQIAVRFLVSQLYTHKFFADPEARLLMPDALRAMAKRDAEDAKQTGGIEARLLGEVHKKVDEFFTEVETNLQKIGM